MGNNIFLIKNNNGSQHSIQIANNELFVSVGLKTQLID